VTPPPTQTGGPMDGGDPPSTSPDASAKPDADAGLALVTVRVRNSTNMPLAGASVLFSDAAGATLGTVTSDANGTAAYPAPSGSQVTVGFGGELAPRLLTITAVEPGDDLVALDPEHAEANVPLTFDGPPPNAPDGAGNYIFGVGRCLFSSSRFPFTVTVSRFCARLDVPLTIYVEARNAVGPLGWTVARDVSFVLDGGTQPVLAFDPWSSTFTRQTVTATNTGDAGTRLIIRNQATANGQLVASYSGEQTNPPITGNDRTATFTSAPVGDGRQASVVGYEFAGSGVRLVGSATRTAVATLDGGLSLEFGDRLPQISASGIDAGVQGRPFVSWTSTGSLAGADGTYVVLSWSEPRDAGRAVGRWTLLVPPTASSVLPPVLPAGFRGAPSTVPSFQDVPAVASVEASFLAGYAQLRSVGGALAPTGSLLEGGNHVVPALPQNGTVRFSAYAATSD
jgi:hypothetical protein